MGQEELISNPDLENPQQLEQNAGGFDKGEGERAGTKGCGTAPNQKALRGAAQTCLRFQLLKILTFTGCF
jgi:hypothetical protein